VRRAAALVLAVLGASACSRRAALNYKHCLRLRVGMTRDEVFKIMGQPEETMPYVEGQSLAYLKGRTAYEWSNPATMPGPDHVSVDDASGTVESIRCSNAEISAAVFPDTASGPAVSTAPARAPAAPLR